jgi:hypothetical protein
MQAEKVNISRAGEFPFAGLKACVLRQTEAPRIRSEDDHKLLIDRYLFDSTER